MKMYSIKALSLMLVTALSISLFTAPAYAASPFYRSCSCEKDYKKNGYVLNQKITYKIEEKKYCCPDEFGVYKRDDKNILELQVGSKLSVITGTSYTFGVDFSVTPKVSNKVIEAALGISLKKATIDLTAQVSPAAVKGKTFVAPYYRIAYHVYDFDQIATTKCSHGKVLNTVTKTITVKNPYKDSAYLRFGAAASKSKLPKTVKSKDNALFDWGSQC